MTIDITYFSQPPQMLQKLLDSAEFQLTPAKRCKIMKS